MTSPWAARQAARLVAMLGVLLLVIMPVVAGPLPLACLVMLEKADGVRPPVLRPAVAVGAVILWSPTLLLVVVVVEDGNPPPSIH